MVPAIWRRDCLENEFLEWPQRFLQFITATK